MSTPSPATPPPTPAPTDPPRPAGAPGAAVSAADATGWFTGFAGAGAPTAPAAPGGPSSSQASVPPRQAGAAGGAAGASGGASGGAATRRHRARALAVALLTVVVVAAGALVLIHAGTGDASSAPSLGSGSAWITTVDGTMLVNGATGEPQESVKFPCGPKSAGACAWHQNDRSLVAYERGPATAHPVDLTSLKVLPAVTIGAPDDDLVMTDAAAYAVDHDRRTIRALDPVSFAAAGSITLERSIGDAVIDATGTLYAVERGTGRIVTVHGQSAGPTIQAGTDQDNLTLGATQSSVFVLNRSTGTAARIDGSVLRDEVHLGAAPSSAAIVPRSAPDDLPVVVDPSSGSITRIDFARQRSDPVGSFPGGSFDGPFVLGSRVAVRDQGSNLLHVVDTARREPEKDIEGVSEVVVKDDDLYANNPQGKGTVVHRDGTRTAIDKGAPTDGGTEAGPAKTPAASSSSGSRKPGTKPSTKVPAHPPKITKIPKKPVPKAPRPTTTKPKPAPKPPARTPPPAAVKPSVPAKPTATAGPDGITVTWAPSTGAPTTYIIRSDQGQEQVSGTPECPFMTRTCVFHGLQPGIPYRFTVAAANAAGTSAPSPPSDPVTLSATPPQAPTDVIATFDPATHAIRVEWADADPKVTGFTVIPNDTTADLPAQAQTVPAATHQVTFTSAQLAAGTSYRFRVRAAGADGGTSLSSFSNTVRPSAAPDAMGQVTVTEPNAGLGATTATLSWAAVADNGAPVTYHVRDQYGKDVGTTTTTSYDYTALQPGDQLTLTVVPVNEAGAGTGAAAQLISYIDLRKGPQPGAAINLVADVTETNVGASYTFTYRIQNGGKAACVPAAVVRIRSAGAPDQVLSVPNLCLRAGDLKDISVTTTLAAGVYTYAALWSDGATSYFPYSNTPTVDHDLVVT